jgi:hypothetical protein
MGNGASRSATDLYASVSGDNSQHHLQKKLISKNRANF